MESSKRKHPQPRAHRDATGLTSQEVIPDSGSPPIETGLVSGV